MYTWRISGRASSLGGQSYRLPSDAAVSKAVVPVARAVQTKLLNDRVQAFGGFRPGAAGQTVTTNVGVRLANATQGAVQGQLSARPVLRRFPSGRSALPDRVA